MITQLQPGEIFVFGSNTAGRHGRGAALQARQKFGAAYGMGEGLTGQCYAFPTLDRQFQKRSRSALEESRDLFYACAEGNPELRFLMTRIGCGLAGYPETQMRALFLNPPPNVILPPEWI